jgi:hypothetical protein
MVNINTFFGWHSWRYRNPYSRRCLECGEQQTTYCYDLKNVQTRQWWEVDKNGNQLKKCSTKEKNIMNIYIDKDQAKILLRLLRGDKINSAEKRELIGIMEILKSQPGISKAIK